MFAIAGLFLLNSCEDNPLDISEDFTYEQEFQVYTTDTAMMVVEVVDMAAYSDLIDKYGDKITEVSISDVKYWLTAFNGDDDQKILEASVEIANADGSDTTMIAEITDQNLQALLDNPTDLTVNQAGIDKMAELIKESPHTFQLIYNNSCNKGPLDFTVKFQFKVSFTANPL